MWASLSPDGRRIAIATGQHIATFDSDGSHYATITQGDGVLVWVQWLSDSETLIYAKQSDYLDQMGTAIEYTFYRVNTQQGGLRPIVELPLGFNLSSAALSPVTDLLAISGTQYELFDGLQGAEPVQFLKLDGNADSVTRVFDAGGEQILELPSQLYNMQWTPNGKNILGYSPPYNGDGVLSVEMNEITPLNLIGDPLPENGYSLLAWESDTTYLVYNGYGYQVDVADFGIWAVDLENGTVNKFSPD